MKNIENLPEALFDLIARKRYEELSDSEKALIKDHVSEEDYEAYRVIIKDFTALDEAMPVKAPTMSFAPKKASIIRKILTYRMPVYQVAGLLLLLLLVTYAIPQQNGGEANSIKEIQDKPKPSVTGIPLSNEDYPDSLVFNL